MVHVCLCFVYTYVFVSVRYMCVFVCAFDACLHMCMWCVFVLFTSFFIMPFSFL